MATIDTALVYDPATRRCDLAFDGTDFVLDDTPATPVLTAVGLDRRAHIDDELPDVTTESYRPGTINQRRGWCGDFLDPFRRLTGSRMWLLRRRKHDEPTRLLAESALREALEPLANDRGWPMAVMVRWASVGMLTWRVTIGEVTVFRHETLA